ncbi:MAG TPA: hypothetical protein VGB60_10395 [Brevundimonas sp.]|jgi:hypothetical protein|uniref:hypothetical protein n=1 Tax=Brevundimonas sp. TaxID=1871086 RepID=UPI002ED9FB17
MSNQKPADGERSRPLRDVAEDATGFGAPEIRMTRDLILNPGAVAAAQGQPDSPYPRSLRYFLTWNGIFLVLVTVLGGFQSQFAALPEPFITWAMQTSGKSRDAFLGDLDQWYSLAAIPVISLFLYLPLAFLFRRWTGSRAAGSGQAFAYVSGWSIYGAAFGLAALFVPAVRAASPVLTVLILAVLFLRMGKGRWWTSGGQALWRFVQLLLGMLIVFVPAVLIVTAITVVGALYGP